MTKQQKPTYEELEVKLGEALAANTKLQNENNLYKIENAKLNGLCDRYEFTIDMVTGKIKVGKPNAHQ